MTERDTSAFSLAGATDDARPANLVSPVIRAFRLLRFMADGGSTANLSEVGRRIGVNRVTVMRLLETLEHEDLIEPLPQGGHRLGLGFLALAATALGTNDQLDAARRVLSRVTADTGLSSYLAVPDGAHVLYLLCEMPHTPLVSNIRVGSRVPAHLTTPGRVLLADLPVSQVRALLGHEPLPGVTAQSATRYAQLEKMLDEDRARGCAWSFSGYESNIDSCAAPVRDTAGRAFAALSVAGPQPYICADAAMQTATERIVKAGAAQLSQLLGHAPAALRGAATATR